MISLQEYGFSPFYQCQIQDEPSYVPARVTQVRRGRFVVATERGETGAVLKGSLLHSLNNSGDYPAVGDFVLVQPNEQGDALIARILERRSKFIRPDQSGHAAGYVKTILEQVVAANFDYVFIVSSLNQEFNLKRIQRYLIVSWQSGGIPVVVLTKADLSPDASEKAREVQRIAAGVDVAAVSAYTGEGMDYLRQTYLKAGKTLVLLGSSGVGKSTLINCLAGKEIMAVSGIREEDGRGRHTTTHRQLLRLPCGALVIDTPGMRELGILDAEDGFAGAYSEIEELFAHCRFSDCSHNNEPGCAVRAALEDGSLSMERWESFLRLRRESKFNEDKAAYLREQREKSKKIRRQTGAPGSKK